MPDISMCQNETCPLRDSCYRFTAEPNHWQSYGSFQWVETSEGPRCKMWWPDREPEERE